MKRLAMAVLIASAVALCSGPVRAADPVETQYEDAITYPLRLAYYALHPVGFAAEWLIARPFHFVISRPYVNKVFGYRPLGEEGSYRRLGERL